MKKSEYQNPKSETNSNDRNIKFKIVSNFVLRISNFQLQSGQALVTLLFFTIIATTIASAAVFMAISNASSTSKIQEGIDAYYIAESGIENALLRLLRDPNYSGEMDLAIGTGNVDIIVSGSNPKTVVATGKNGNFIRKVQAEMNYNSGFYTFSKWREL